MSIEAYQDAKKLGEKAYRKAVNDRTNPYLPSLDSILKDKRTAGNVYVNTQEVPIALIAGTRSDERGFTFANNFMPLLGARSEFAQKWSNLYDIQIEEGIRDPVKVVEYMHRFYVEEGNKRVSVLSYLGVPAILVDITRILPVKTNDPDVVVYYEFLEFYRVTHTYDIQFTRPGSYQRFAALLNRDLSHEWPKEVVTSIRGAYFRFSSVYAEMAQPSFEITAGDAFLIYLLIYQLDSLLDTSREKIQERLDKIWGELLLQNSSSGKLLLRENPMPEREVGFLQSLLNRPMSYTEKHPLKAAFLYERNLQNSGWANDHDVGRITVENYYEGILETWYYENCQTETEIETAIEDAIQKGAEAIFTTSAIQMRSTLRASIRYPRVRFANCSLNLPHDTIRTYSIREYGVKFLMGALAAVYAKNHKIGYLATYPALGNVSGINAFAIGAGMIDPKAKIYVSWSEMKECHWKEQLQNEAITVYTGPDFSVEGGDHPEFGLCEIDETGEISILARPIRNWGKYYEIMIKMILQDRWNQEEGKHSAENRNDWWGIASGVIDIHLSGSVPFYSRKMIDFLKSGLIAESLDPFRGELHSQTACIQKETSPKLASEAIIRMDWLCDNVVGRIPSKEELNEKSQRAMEDMTFAGDTL